MAKTKKNLSPADKLKEICPLLSAIGVTRVVTTYDGSGDSGDLSDTRFCFHDRFSEHDNEAADSQTNGRSMYFDQFKSTHAMPTGSNPNPLITVKMLDAFYETLFELLPGGWEINEGSYGDIEIDVAKSKVKLVHNERIVETNTSQQEW
jgi:hypothetical protein